MDNFGNSYYDVHLRSNHWKNPGYDIINHWKHTLPVGIHLDRIAFNARFTNPYINHNEHGYWARALETQKDMELFARHSIHIGSIAYIVVLELQMDKFAEMVQHSPPYRSKIIRVYRIFQFGNSVLPVLRQRN